MSSESMILICVFDDGGCTTMEDDTRLHDGGFYTIRTWKNGGFVAHQMDNDHAWCSSEKKMIRSTRRTYDVSIRHKINKRCTTNEKPKIYSPISILSRFIRLYRRIHFIRMQTLGCKPSKTRTGIRFQWSRQLMHVYSFSSIDMTSTSTLTYPYYLPFGHPQSTH